jgi:hypothetical protein
MRAPMKPSSADQYVWPLIWAAITLAVLGLGIAALILSVTAENRNNMEAVKIMVLVNNVTSLELDEFINLHNVTTLGQNITDIELRIVLLQGDIVYAEYHIVVMFSQLLLINQRINNIYNYNLTAIYQVLQRELTNITFIHSEINRLQDLIVTVQGNISAIQTEGIVTINNSTSVNNNIDLLGECGISTVPHPTSHTVDISGAGLQLQLGLLMYRLTIESMILFQRITLSNEVVNTINGRSPIAGNIQLVSTNILTTIGPGVASNAVRLTNRVIRAIGNVGSPQVPNGAGQFAFTSTDSKIATLATGPSTVNIRLNVPVAAVTSMAAYGGSLVSSTIPASPCSGVYFENQRSIISPTPALREACYIIGTFSVAPSTIGIVMRTPHTVFVNYGITVNNCKYIHSGGSVTPLDGPAAYLLTVDMEILVPSSSVFPPTPAGGDQFLAGLQVIWCIGPINCITNGPYNLGPIMGMPIRPATSTSFTSTYRTTAPVPMSDTLQLGLYAIGPYGPTAVTPVTQYYSATAEITLVRTA